MQFNQVSEDQIQIIITKSDLVQKNMRALLQDIIKHAQQNYGFEIVNDTSLMVETFPLSEESIIVMITRVNPDDIDVSKLFSTESTYDDPSLTLVFQDIEEVISLAKAVTTHIETDTALYKFDDQFYLYIEDADEIIEDARGHFIEYGELSFYTKSFLSEHGDVFIEHDALYMLGNL